MKRLLSLIISAIIALGISAQKCSVPIAIAFKKEAQPIPESSQRAVAAKLRQVLSANGVSGSAGLQTFGLVPSFEILDKSVTPGPPKQIACKLLLSLNILNLEDGVVFASYSTELNGAATSEIAAIMDAVKRLAPKNNELSAFVNQGHERIIKYYNSKAETTLAKADMLTRTRKYDEALALLMSIPECTSGYKAAIKKMGDVWQARINVEGMKLLAEAQTIWKSRTDSESAIEAAKLLAQIDPESTSYKDAGKLMNEIKEKAEANTPWDFSLKVYEDSINLEEQRLNAAKEVAIAYAENQQESNTTYTIMK